MRVRFFLAMALVITAVVALFLLLLATDTALSVWQQLQDAPAWVRYGWISALPGGTYAARRAA